jgi:hypothetical protein
MVAKDPSPPRTPSATGPPAPGGHSGGSACAETKSEAQLGTTLAAPGYGAQRSRLSAANDHFFGAGRGRDGATNGRCAATASHLTVGTVPRAKAPLRVTPRQPLSTLLRQQRASVRQAVILREVLGPPRGLHPLDDLGSF